MSSIIKRPGALFAELKRRRVLRTAGLYLVAAWAAIEVTATVFPLLFFPDWAPRAVVVASVLGLPVVLVLSWAFDLTSEGVQRADPRVDRRALPASARVGLVALTVLVTGVAGWGARGLWMIPPTDDDGGALDPSRVAVLYFDDFSPDGSLRFLADGLTEALIHELTQMEPLEVVSRYGVKPYREQSLPFDSLARALAAGTLVEGSVEGSGDRLAATIQLIDGRTGAHLLSRRFKASGGDILALRDSLVQESARSLGKALGRELEVERLRSETNSPGAWEHVERARRLIEDADTLRWSLGDADAAREALLHADSLLSAAARLDPAWSQPPLFRARVAADLAGLGSTRRQDKDPAILREGIRHTGEALARDPRNAEALAWRGTLRSQLSWTGEDSVAALLEAAEADFRAAVELDESQARAWVGLAELMRARGDFAEAAVAAERALEADAFLIHAEQTIVFRLGHIWLELEQFDRALRWAREAQRRYPAVPSSAAVRLAIAAGWPGAEETVDSAWALVRHVERSSGMTVWPAGHLQVAAILAREGQPDSARSVVERARDARPGDPWLDYYEANVRIQLGEPGRALDLLESFTAAMPHRRSYIAEDWWWRPLRDSLRFRQINAHP